MRGGVGERGFLLASVNKPVIPAKAGIQKVEAKFATRNQAPIASDKSLLP